MVNTESDVYDVLIIGGGFCGLYLLRELRKLGHRVLLIEAGADIGGVWHWNCYPGARVDTDVPAYEFSAEELWQDWTWSELFPRYDEIRRYFEYVESKWEVKKDTQLNTFITNAKYDNDNNQWVLWAKDGRIFKGRFFIPCLGFSSKLYVPAYKGLDTFEGPCYHTAVWPQDGSIELKGKRVGVIGNGASGVQVVQEVGPVAGQLTLFQRTYNTALPMMQKKLATTDQNKSKYAAYFKFRTTTFSGLNQTDFNPNSTLTVSSEERERVYEALWAKGSFSFWWGNFVDMLVDETANRHAYDFWRRKTIARIKDPKKAEILAPKEPSHYFCTKRPSLEMTYYETFNNDHVDVVDLKTNPISEICPRGIRTKDGILHEFDVIVLATGFDSVTGGLLQINIRGLDNISLKEKWSNGVLSMLGLLISGFPNMFTPYGPLGPTSFSSGPTSAELQGAWVAQTIDAMYKTSKSRINAKPEFEAAWTKLVNEACSRSLISKTDTWWNGQNIPGKPRQMLSYFGGIPTYCKYLAETIASQYEGFELQ